MGLVTKSLCTNFTRGHWWIVEMAVDRPICAFVLCFGGELWFGCVIISRKSLRACLLTVFWFCDGWLRVYDWMLFVLFERFFFIGGAPDLVLYKRCPLRPCIKGAPWIVFPEPYPSRCDNEHAGSNAICPDRAQDYPCPRILICLPSQNVVKRQSTHVVARYNVVKSPRSGPQTLTTGLPWDPYPARGHDLWGGLCEGRHVDWDT